MFNTDKPLDNPVGIYSGSIDYEIITIDASDDTYDIFNINRHETTDIDKKKPTESKHYKKKKTICWRNAYDL